MNLLCRFYIHDYSKWETTTKTNSYAYQECYCKRCNKIKLRLAGI